jgi:hypothetical protein
MLTANHSYECDSLLSDWKLLPVLASIVSFGLQSHGIHYHILECDNLLGPSDWPTSSPVNCGWSSPAVLGSGAHDHIFFFQNFTFCCCNFFLQLLGWGGAWHSNCYWSLLYWKQQTRSLTCLVDSNLNIKATLLSTLCLGSELLGLRTRY